MRFLIKCLGFFLLAPYQSVGAQDLMPEQLLGDRPYESPSCNLKDFHELDFMLGTWDLKVMIDGLWVPGGYSTFKPALGGCIITNSFSFEKWGDFYKSLSGRPGYAGLSIFSYDRKARNWRQVWHDDMGTVVTNMRGRKFEDGMRFVGHAPTQDGAELQRMEWKVAGETIRLLNIDMSTDGGMEWTRIATLQMIKRPE